METDMKYNGTPRKTGISILITSKIEFKARALLKSKMIL